MHKFITLTFLLLGGGMACGQEFSTERIKKHIEYLASDELKGRGTSTPEELKAAQYIAAEFKKTGLKPLRNDFLRPFKYRKGLSPHDTAKSAEEFTANNVVGFLDNKAPYTIVIGAHYDHLGLGHDHNSLDANPTGKIHNGADDNASGTAGVMELARYFAGNKQKEPFNFLFICFSGEEFGLLGSKKWCDDPDLPHEKMNYMINLDMIGRLNDSTKKIIVYGVGTSPVFVPMIAAQKSDLVIKTDSSGIGPSDQTSFYLKNVPVLHFFTGQHADYHKPSDDIEKINLAGEAAVLKYIVQLVEGTYSSPKLQFLKTRTPDTGKSAFKVTLGVMPDYAFDGQGMRIDGVTDNKPAHKAGLQKGDIVVKLGEDEVKDVQGYMKALSKYKKGDAASLSIMRNGELKTVTVQF